jgi:hypothetical protein
MSRILPLLLATIVLLSPIVRVRAEGDLDAIRSDVRTPPAEPAAPPAPPSTPPERPGPKSEGSNPFDGYEDEKGNLMFAGLVVGAIAVTTPYWLPRALLDDEDSEAFFARFPYDNAPGFLISDDWCSGFTAEKVLAETLAEKPAGTDPGDPTKPPQGSLVSLGIDPSARRWGGQFRADYADEFDNLTAVGGRLVLESTSRWGVDTSAHYLREQLSGGGYDHLTLGDCNLVYRFAQGKRGEMRMGLGANWMNDASRTDLGFNFTYGGDFFPRKPWVLSSEIDWGTLGRAGLFRFRTTGGVIWNRFESYIGYEYLDIGATQSNFLIGGVRVWF